MKIDKYINDIKSHMIGENFFRLGKAFRTFNNFYFLDTGTGKVFQISEPTYRILDCIFKTNSLEKIKEIDMDEDLMEKALVEICLEMKKNNLFLAPVISRENIVGNHMNLEKNLSSEMSSVTLELTEKCNLRCKYCIYGETNENYRCFGSKDMSFDTARKAIDFLMEHSKRDKKVYIGFYGGEPLLKFDLIKEICEYTETNFPDREIMYSMTTNGTLINTEIAKYLASKRNLSLVISLDGPEDIHDSNRVFINNRGSFSETMKGLEKFVKYKNLLDGTHFFLVSSVLTPPYNNEKIEKIDKFFNKMAEKYCFGFLTSYVSRTTKEEDYVPIIMREENQWEDNLNDYWVYDPLNIWTLANLDRDPFLKKTLVKESLIGIHRRNISDSPISYYSLNGCCVPGGRRLYVTVNGEYLPCERIGTTPYIGDVNRGLDIEKIKKEYIDKFIDEEIRYCGECWAINLCNNCYIDCFDDHGINFSHRHELCKNTRGILCENLSIYHEILEKNPEIINGLNDIIIE